MATFAEKENSLKIPLGSQYQEFSIRIFLSHFPPAQIYKNPFQRIVYRAYEKSNTVSTLDIEPNSQVFQEFFQSTAKYPQVNYIVIRCQVTIYHLYDRDDAQKVMLSDDLLMTPNLLELGGSRPAKPLSGPDNSPYRSSSSSSGASSTSSGSSIARCLPSRDCIVMQLVLMGCWAMQQRLIMHGAAGGGGGYSRKT